MSGSSSTWIRFDVLISGSNFQPAPSGKSYSVTDPGGDRVDDIVLLLEARISLSDVVRRKLLTHRPRSANVLKKQHFYSKHRINFTEVVPVTNS